MLKIPPRIPPTRVKTARASYDYQILEEENFTPNFKTWAPTKNITKAPKANPSKKTASLTQQRAINPPPMPTKIDTKRGIQISFWLKDPVDRSLSPARIMKQIKKKIKNPAIKMIILINLRPKSKYTMPTPIRPRAPAYNIALVR